MKDSNLRVIAISAILMLVAVVVIGKMVIERLDRIARLAERDKKTQIKEQVAVPVKQTDSIHREDTSNRSSVAASGRVIVQRSPVSVGKNAEGTVPSVQQDGGSQSAVSSLSSPGAGENVLISPSLPKKLYTGLPKTFGSMILQDPWGGNDTGLLVPQSTRLLSAKKPVTSSDTAPVIGELELITDGDKEGTDGSYVELRPGPQWVQIDLGAEHPVYAVAVWHYHAQARVYHDVAILLSKDKDCASSTVMFNNDKDNTLGIGEGQDKEYVESYKGLLRGVDGVSARYIRLYSNGSTSSELNHYIEVEVYGLTVNASP